ncbi:S28 family serine protease [Umezawaea sp. NPDC059074]|uniref:S28 family serine protease n=1 Tax=Umezawaea sp. NPDC059074 TaxID=3346716 RepID=UPI0036D049AE
MTRLTRLLVVLLLGLSQVAVGVPPDLDTELAHIQGLRIISKTTVGDYLYYVLGFQQPVDHRHPSRGTFEQRISLQHKDESRPMILHTTGYGLPGGPGLSEPARLVDGNQLSVEQRFFTPSRPQPANWRDLDIRQAADDHHRIVQAFKRIYHARWLSTGASKGGMTSVYHRRFFPHDVDATIAYVAPNDVDDAHDVYGRFIEQVGDDDSCNRRLEGVQRQILQHRDDVVKIMLSRGYTYDTLFGTPQRALEILVLDTPFTFWQYQTQVDCALVPGPDATVAQLVEFMDATVGFDFYTDAGVAPYTPYYYQAGTQLGSPKADEHAVADLLRYPGSSVPRSFVPADIPMRFEPGAMRDVDRWVRLSGRTLLFVYGGNDPWGAEPFRLGPGTRDSFSFTVPGGNHGSTIAKLPEPQRNQATAAVLRWANVPVRATVPDGPGPDDLAELRRRPR